MPSNKRQLERFLGLVGYYRSFIEGFSDIAEPLRELRPKGAEFRWDDRQQAAFDQLVSKVAEDVVLKVPDFGKEFVLETDASNVAVGATLNEKDNGGGSYPKQRCGGRAGGERWRRRTLRRQRWRVHLRRHQPGVE